MIECLGQAPLQTFRLLLRQKILRISGLAHVAGRGDLWRSGNTLGEPGGGASIEGFQIDEAPGFVGHDFNYQAIGEGVDPAWAPLGAFVGSRGLGMPIKGLGVRIQNIGATMPWRLSATFVDGSAQVINGKDGVAVVEGDAPLGSFTFEW